MAESDIRKIEETDETAAKNRGETTAHKESHGHTHHSPKDSEEHAHDHQHDRKKRRMNMKARLVPVFIVLAISLITMEARAAVGAISDRQKTSTKAIEPIEIPAPATSLNGLPVDNQIEKQIVPATEITYATAVISIEDGLIDVSGKSIPLIAINDINITSDIGNVDEDADINTIVIASISDVEANSIGNSINA
jgi:hypothetical protein